MASVLRSCIQSLLKLVNSIIAMAGIAMIIYSLWMIRVWQKETGESIFDVSDYPLPWFIYTFMGVGVTLCVITCSGHIGAETSNGCCLYLYMVFVFLLFVLEAVITADIFLNHDWEEDLPTDKTGNLDILENFVAKNFDFCKWIGLSVVAAQGISFLLAMILKALGPHQERYYDPDDDYYSARVPLLKNSSNAHYVVGEPVYGARV